MTNTAQYTPGPWILGGCSGRMITTPNGYVGDGFIADVDTLANAYLIASAPVLLETLEKLLFWLEYGKYSDLPLKAIEDMQHDKATARAVIAKAKGAA